MAGSVTTAVAKDGNGSTITGGARVFDVSGAGSGPIVPMSVPSDLNGNAVDLSLPSQVVGSVASGATDSGNPVKVGAPFNSTLPSPTNGQRVDLQSDGNGNLRVVPVTFVAAGSDGFSNTNIGFSRSSTLQSGTALFAQAPYKFNGTGWDRQVKPNAVSRIASAAASTNATSAKASAGNAFKVAGYNAKASVVYLKLYNKASAPTVGTDTPFMTIPLAASAVFNIDFAELYFSTGVAYGFTTDAADNGTTALAAGDILGFSLVYA
jgi:hypothetical protein